jgi:hypothetical protein
MLSTIINRANDARFFFALILDRADDRSNVSELIGQFLLSRSGRSFSASLIA